MTAAPRLPGVNGASATALKSISTDLATAEGFGKGRKIHGEERDLWWVWINTY
jgi:hypothetical protein